jgi:hypothetical protein
MSFETGVIASWVRKSTQHIDEGIMVFVPKAETCEVHFFSSLYMEIACRGALFM